MPNREKRKNDPRIVKEVRKYVKTTGSTYGDIADKVGVNDRQLELLFQPHEEHEFEGSPTAIRALFYIRSMIETSLPAGDTTFMKKFYPGIKKFTDDICGGHYPSFEEVCEWSERVGVAEPSDIFDGNCKKEHLDDVCKQIGRSLKALRKLYGLTSEQFGDIIGCAKQSVFHVESDRFNYAKSAVAMRYAIRVVCRFLYDFVGSNMKDTATFAGSLMIANDIDGVTFIEDEFLYAYDYAADLMHV